jgi:hypothetical protein
MPEGERQRRNISARKVFELRRKPKTHFSKARPQVHAILRRTHGLQQAWINSRNQTTIATQAKHRQLMFLHPTENEARSGEGMRRQLAESASSLYTTQVFHSTYFIIQDKRLRPADVRARHTRVHGKVRWASVRVGRGHHFFILAPASMWRTQAARLESVSRKNYSDPRYQRLHASRKRGGIHCHGSKRDQRCCLANFHLQLE